MQGELFWSKIKIYKIKEKIFMLNFPNIQTLFSKNKNMITNILSTEMPSVRWLECIRSLERMSTFFLLQPISTTYNKRQHTLIALSKKGEIEI